MSHQLAAAIAEVDDRRLPIAEVSRRIGRRAEALGLPRPSYANVLRLVHEHRARQDEERERREALRGIATDVAERLIAGRYVDPYLVADRVARVNRP